MEMVRIGFNSGVYLQFLWLPVGVYFSVCIMPLNVIIFRAASVVKQYPGVKVMVDHCGIAYERDPQSMKIWREGDWYLLSSYYTVPVQ